MVRILTIAHLVTLPQGHIPHPIMACQVLAEEGLDDLEMPGALYELFQTAITTGRGAYPVMRHLTGLLQVCVPHFYFLYPGLHPMAPGKEPIGFGKHDSKEP